MTKEWKLTFDKDKIKVSKVIERPSDGKLTDVDIETIEYDKIKNFHILVQKIELKSENDTIKSLIFHVSEFEFLEQETSEAIYGNAGVFIIDNEKKYSNRKNDILKITATWLFESGRIRENDLPIYVLNGGRYLLNKIPYHKNNRKFDGKPYKIKEGIYLNTNFSANDCRRQAEYLMKKFAPDVKFEIVAW